MVTNSGYTEKIKNYTWGDLEELWAAVQQRDTPDWESGKALEYLVLRAFQLDRAEIRWPYSVRLQASGEELEQIDGVIYLGELACLVECKDYNDAGRKKNINFEPVAKMRSQLMRRPSSAIGSIFSSGGFTSPALTLANFTYPQTILLWNGIEIGYCLAKRIFSRALVTKYRKCIEFGIHDYDITVEEEL
jgi:hypothetical protein